MSNESLRRERNLIEATEWWSLFMAELQRRADREAHTALTSNDLQQIYRAQGGHRVLTTLINALSDLNFLTGSEEE